MSSKSILSILLLAIILAFIPSGQSVNVHKNEYLADVQGPACPLCTLLVGKVKEAASEYKGLVTEEFKQLVCKKLPSATQGLCNQFVEEYGPAVIDALLKKLDPQAVCSKLGLCDDAVWFRKYVTDKDAYLIYIELQQMGESNDNCAMCKYIVGEVEQYANSSREELEHRLIKACELLPGQLEQLCDTVILLYGPQILDYILTYETPEIVCKQVGLCPKTAQEETPVVPAPVPVQDDESNDGKCELCKYVLNLAEEYIQGNATEEKIKDALHKVCNKFPPIAGACVAFVDQYEPMIVEYLLQKLTPEQICQKIGLCPKSVPVIEFNDESACPLCKFVVGTVEEYMVKNESIAVIEEKVHQICDFLPETYSGMCKSMADMYVPQIIGYLKEKYTPAAVCEALTLCPKEEAVAPVQPSIEGPKVVQMRTN
eukprot:CAMPEP_0117448824 /NCGR_PEP_ID=MMETSP0759-20121206/7611_1 /TAXON_ID=63605 /ORGANISM="Percolomonas cosmopolitus, Strain WS" /LENGTH=427 /DNA_ID=CAMNT_0005241245 /DNA_START=17 /DNA_END=1300 /DNA_ORIENTATION=-